jgi:NADPH-dependent 2,4-dienoyl-CoA reductase/sulfur reductase-like enzyme
LADPEWPRKAWEGREDEIIPCISCNDGCIGGRIFKDLHIRCAVNPLTGRERLGGSLAPVDRRKKVFVVGGGPGGMAAALTAARMGHRVTLLEENRALGGQLRLAAVPPGKEKILWFLDYLLTRLSKEGVALRLGRPATVQGILRGKPDAVILATGAKPVVPTFRAANGARVHTAWDVLAGRKNVKGERVAVVGGGTVGCETALFLAQQNRKVTVIEMLDRIASDMEPINRMDLLARLQRADVEVLFERNVERIERGRVVVRSTDGTRETIAASAVVVAVGAASTNGLLEGLEGKVPRVERVGDCVSPRKIMDAVQEGFLAARTL